jgi:5-methylcytosine-specific restriction protein B
MDLALRRRFHFVNMEPRREVLRAWLIKAKKPLWIEALFRRLNDALRAEKIGDDYLVGHAHFMSDNLSEDFLELIWEGSIEPMLKEYFFTEPERLKKFQLDNFNIGALTAMEDEKEIAGDADETESFEPNHSKAISP